MTVREYSGLLAPGSWRRKPRRESLSAQLSLAFSFQQSTTGSPVLPCGKIKVSTWLLLLITMKSFSNIYMEYDFTNFNLFWETRKSSKEPQSRHTLSSFWVYGPSHLLLRSITSLGWLSLSHTCSCTQRAQDPQHHPAVL